MPAVNNLMFRVVKRGGKEMIVNCTSCGREINLDHKVFHDYDGPVKCFCCGVMMEIKVADGFLHSINSLNIPEYAPANSFREAQ
jgi:DNA-directed RNA polymerase subunit N (RpoN/RPB10)